MIAKAGAKRRNLVWNINFVQYEKLRFKLCHYCGGKLSKTGGGLDRKDNLKGYTLNNAIPCCLICNRIKGAHLTYKQMLELSPMLTKFRKRRPEE